MSSLKVEIVQIKSVETHPNADRLDIATIAGWQCVVGRDTHKPGDEAIYIPIDAVLGPEIECYLFPPDSKIQLSKSRVRTIKLRGAISQGMLVDLSYSLLEKFPLLRIRHLGDDVADILGITKYEPPARDIPNHMQGNSQKRPNPHFQKYTDIENFKHYPDVFEQCELVYVTEKLHGTSARFAKLPVEANTVWKRILQFLHLLPPYEFCFGSRRVQLQDKPKHHKGFYEENVYAMMAHKYHLAKLLKPGEALYGEIVGHGIQGGYNYGCQQGEYLFFAYDVQINGKYLDVPDFVVWCEANNIQPVPQLTFGAFDSDRMNLLRQGDSTIGNQKIREGIVIKPGKERWDHRIGRVVLKHINDAYLLQKDGTDFQ